MSTSSEAPAKTAKRKLSRAKAKVEADTKETVEIEVENPISEQSSSTIVSFGVQLCEATNLSAPDLKSLLEEMKAELVAEIARTEREIRRTERASPAQAPHWKQRHYSLVQYLGLVKSLYEIVSASHE